MFDKQNAFVNMRAAVTFYRVSRPSLLLKICGHS